MFYTRFACFASMFLLCVGCTHHAYEGRTKPYQEVAVIKDSYTGSLRRDRASIAGLDDQSFRLSWWSMPEAVDVLPGEHRVSIYCWHGFGPDANAGIQGRLGSVNFTSQAGHEYQVFCRVEDGRFVRWIQDTTTGEIVGEPGQ
jgi:hypothetical protein